MDRPARLCEQPSPQEAFTSRKILWRSLHLFDPALSLDRTADLLLENGRVAGIGPGLSSRAAVVMNGEGMIAFPGFCDVHCHLREPGDAQKETLDTGLRAAAAGGFVAVVAMANTRPPVDEPSLLASLLSKAAQVRGAKLFQAGAATIGLAGERPTDAAALRAAGAACLSDDGKFVERSEVMREVMERAKAQSLTVMSHAEDPQLADGGVVSDGPVGRALALPLRPAEAEHRAVVRDIGLAAQTGAHLHLCHLSTAFAVERVREAKRRGVNVTAEATPHHLLLTEQAELAHGGLARVNPPLRTEADRSAVWEGFCDGTVDTLATDHAPHTEEEKNRPLETALPGMAGLEIALSLLWQEVRQGHLSWTSFVERGSYGPWHALGLPQPRIAEGEAIALTLFDPQRPFRPRSQSMFRQAALSPFADRTFIGRPIGIVLEDGEVRP